MTVESDTPVEEANELPAVLGAIRRGWLAVVAFAVVGAAVGLGVSLLQTPIYESSAELYVTSGADDATTTAYQGSLASQQRVSSYARLAVSDSVVRQAIQDSKIPLSASSAQDDLKASADEKTVILTITGRNTNRDVARDLTNAVSRAMISYVARLETPVEGGQPLARLTLISPAVSSASPVVPRTARNVALGVLTGLLVGIIAVIINFRYSSRVRRESDFARVSGLTVLSSIPTDKTLSDSTLVDFGHGATEAAEAFRRLRTALAYVRVDRPPHIILVTSPRPIEGKTTTAMNLAASIAESGRRVIVVDADLRRPKVHARSGLVGDVGLTTLLRDEAEIGDVVQPSSVDNLDVLASGQRPPNPPELLGNRRTGQVLQELSNRFDLVVVDSPPVLPVTDSVEIAQWVDGIVLVARAGLTRLSDVAETLKRLGQTPAPVLGFVLSDANAPEARYGYGDPDTRDKLPFSRRPRNAEIESMVAEKRS